MHFGQPQLPRHAGVVDGVAGSRAGAAVVTGNQHDACTRFGDARRDGPDAGLRHQLDGNIRVVVGIFQVIDELRQVLNGIDVVVWGRRNQGDARRGIAGLCNPRIDLFAR